MPPPVVVVDANNEAWRSFFSTGSLSHNGNTTGVVFGFMRTVQTLEARWPLCRLVFAFDHGKNLREIKYPWYKATRRAKRKEEKKDPAKRKMFEAMDDQVQALKTSLLRRAGYRNVFYADGYEADDVIARVVDAVHARNAANGHGSHEARKVVVVSGDEDFYQLLHPDVSVYQPKNDLEITEYTFRKKYLKAPKDWVKVKAIAGCKSDDIPGIEGVGEGTAVKFLRDCMLVSDRQRDLIYDWMTTREYARNLKLISLPLAGCPDFEVKRDKPNPGLWNRVVGEIGATSLMKATTPWGGSEEEF